MLKRIRWKLIDKWWPDGKPFRDAVRAKRGGQCNACGACCALITISVDQEYMREQNYAIRVWNKANGKVLTDAERRSIRDHEFILKYWVQVPRHRAAERGFVKSVESHQFVYHCLLLTKDGKCGAHDEFRPKVCEDYPFYDGAKWPEGHVHKPNVRIGCGFADKRCK